jgi:hypothetical protein
VSGAGGRESTRPLRVTPLGCRFGLPTPGGRGAGASRRVGALVNGEEGLSERPLGGADEPVGVWTAGGSPPRFGIGTVTVGGGGETGSEGTVGVCGTLTEGAGTLTAGVCGTLTLGAWGTLTPGSSAAELAGVIICPAAYPAPTALAPTMMVRVIAHQPLSIGQPSRRVGASASRTLSGETEQDRLSGLQPAANHPTQGSHPCSRLVWAVSVTAWRRGRLRWAGALELREEIDAS